LGPANMSAVQAIRLIDELLPESAHALFRSQQSAQTRFTAGEYWEPHQLFKCRLVAGHPAQKPETTPIQAANSTTANASMIHLKRKMCTFAGFKRGRIQELEHRPPARLHPADVGVTVLISVFKAPKCLMKQLRHWKACSVVNSIRINWFNGNEQFMPKADILPMISDTETPGSPGIIFDDLPDNVTHRFAPRKFATLAVFSTDVGSFYTCDALKALYAVWREHPTAAVGFHPHQNPSPKSLQQVGPSKKVRVEKAMTRTVPLSKVKSATGQSTLMPRTLLSGTPEKDMYSAPYTRSSMVSLTSGAIQHRDTFRILFSAKYHKLRASVDQMKRGEDALMGLVQSTEVDAHAQLVCVDVYDSCHASCNEGVQDLNEERSSRDSLSAQAIDEELHRDLKTQSGHVNVTWLGAGCKQKSVSAARLKVPVICNSKQQIGNTFPCDGSAAEVKYDPDLER